MTNYQVKATSHFAIEFNLEPFMIYELTSVFGHCWCKKLQNTRRQSKVVISNASNPGISEKFNDIPVQVTKSNDQYVFR